MVNLSAFVKHLMVFFRFLFLSGAAFLLFSPAGLSDAFQAAAEDGFEIDLLSEEDETLYRQIFILQEDGKWDEADRLIAQLSDPVLMGHVRFQRYMHPTQYRSAFRELSDWMAAFADHPGANRIYRLAKRRQGSARSPEQPVPLARSPGAQQAKVPVISSDSRSYSERSALSSFQGKFSLEIRRNNPERAEKRLWAFEAREIFTKEEWARAIADVAENHFYNNNDEKALALAALAKEENGGPTITASWIGGLAAWRLGRCGEAAESFAHLANGLTSDPWLQAAGAFWAARSFVACRKPEEATAMLAIAARNKETFYGLLAARQLGLEPPFRWDPVPLIEDEYQALSKIDGVRRAVALAEVGQYDLADEELRLVWSRGETSELSPLVALAERLDLPATQVTLARTAPSGTFASDKPFYPVPLWQPDGGFEVDRALMLGFMRQESHFIPRARSYAGAMGLMQLMPATASFIARDRSLRWSRSYKLYQPEFNMAVSQTYMQHLFGESVTEGNLLKFVAAYNGGPGNLGRWKARINYGDDPLLFIETLPAFETRSFVEKVMANFWIYRIRFGQPTPSLDALAEGKWPVYHALDHETTQVAETESGEAAETAAPVNAQN